MKLQRPDKSQIKDIFFNRCFSVRAGFMGNSGFGFDTANML